MKRIKLTQGKYTVVDNRDYEWLNKYKWYAWCRRGNWYATRSDYTTGKLQAIRMHRQILGLKLGDGKITDHVDRNGLNNKRNNLRVASRQGNKANSKSSRRSTSRYKGVCWYPNLSKWLANITANGKTKHLGYFKIEKDAALAYDAAAKKVFGEFAKVNF